MPQKSKKSDERLAAGLARLRAGWTPELWVCREFLCLDGDPDAWEVIRAVHETIHGHQKNRTAESVREMTAAFTAGAALLRNIPRK